MTLDFPPSVTLAPPDDERRQSDRRGGGTSSRQAPREPRRSGPPAPRGRRRGPGVARDARRRRRPDLGVPRDLPPHPLARIFYDAVTDDAGAFTLGHFHAFFTDRYYLRSLWNSLLLGVGVVAASSVLGIGIAFLLVRYEFWGRSVFSYLTLIPIISPPLVGVLGFVFILGRAGTVNVLLMDHLDLVQPVNFMYGLHGVLLVETLHLFPMITLNVVDALGKVDPALEEAAESVGRAAGGSSGR